MFGAGFLLGAVRVSVLVPRLGVRVAELLEMPIMFVVVVLAARFIVRHFKLTPSVSRRLLTGFVALALVIAAEIAFVMVFQGQTLGQYIASRDPVSGSVYVAMLGLFAAMPFILARVQRCLTTVRPGKSLTLYIE